VTTKEFKPGQHIHINLSGRRIEEATIKAVIEHTDGIRLQVDFGHDQTALIELWQVVKKAAELARRKQWAFCSRGERTAESISYFTGPR
jgi:hypothetical protein